MRHVDLNELYNNYHIIWVTYSWSKETVERLKRSERKRWAEFCEEWQKQIHGGGEGSK